MKFIISISTVLFVLGTLTFPDTADAKRLGSCKRCVTDSGIEAHIWTKGGTFRFCEGMNMNDGGDGRVVLCDAQAGVNRHAESNDPFWKCQTGASDHSAWIGGENHDLIVLGKDPLDINKGKLFRIQDGDEYRCRLDFGSGANFSVLKYGKNRDLMDIYIHDGNNDFRRVSDNIFNGKFHAMVFGNNFVARLYGNHKDILKLYGVTAAGELVEKSRFINDGKDHTIQKLTETDLGVTWGQNDDINVRFCFDGLKWTTGYIGIRQPFKHICDTVLNW